MSILRIENGDWLKNAALLGFWQVLETKAKSSTNEIKVKPNYIEFDSELLSNFEESYFKILIDKNEKTISWYKIISYENALKNFDIEVMTEKDLEIFNKILDFIKTKIKSNSYKSGYLLLEGSDFILENEKKLKMIKLKKNESPINYKKEFLEVKERLQNIINYMKKPEVKRIIAAKNVIYEIIQPFWSNVSFLLTTKSNFNMYELYKSDFIAPLINYEKEDKEKAKYSCFTCDNKIVKLGKPNAFDLTWLNMGVDMSRKSSHFWNFKGDAYICPLCNLVYSCLPLGFNILKGKGLFINNNQSLIKLKQSNVIEGSYSEDIKEIEQMSYFNILKSMEQQKIDNIDKEFENIQVIKIDGNNSLRPYSFNILSKKIMKIIFYNRKRLESLIKVNVKVTEKYYINLYNEVIRDIYDGKNLFDLIGKLFTLKLSKGYIYTIIKINNDILSSNSKKYISNSKGECFIMKENLNKIKEYGFVLKEKYKFKNSESKINGISYKLLNAIKTKDTGRFMDTIINSYMYIGNPVPSVFIDSMKSENSLQTVGYAFLVGLQGEVDNKKGVDDKNKDINENNESEGK